MSATDISTLSALSMTSREVAELCGKRHDHVLRDIDALIETLTPELGLGFKTSSYDDSTGKSNRMFTMDRDSTYCLVAGYDANARMKIIKRWQDLEAKVAQAPALPVLTPAQVLVQVATLLAEQEQRQLALEAHQSKTDERVHRIEAKQAAFEEGTSYFTVIGYATWKALPPIDLTTAKKLGKLATRISNDQKIMIDRVKDQRFGTVNAYHESVLDLALAAFMED